MLRTTADSIKMPPAASTLSIEKLVTGPRSEAFAEIRYLADRLAQLGNAVEQLDAALMTVMTDNSSTEQQALVDASRQLSLVLAGSAVPE